MVDGELQHNPVAEAMNKQMKKARDRFGRLKLRLYKDLQIAIREDASGLRKFQRETLALARTHLEKVLSEPDMKDFVSFHRHSLVSPITHYRSKTSPISL